MCHYNEKDRVMKDMEKKNARAKKKKNRIKIELIWCFSKFFFFLTMHVQCGSAWMIIGFLFDFSSIVFIIQNIILLLIQVISIRSFERTELLKDGCGRNVSMKSKAIYSMSTFFSFFFLSLSAPFNHYPNIETNWMWKME